MRAECFAEKAREAAGEADIVVTNHALLAIDAIEDFQVLPEHDVVIIDEAHDLVDRVTSVASAELSASMVDTAARRCGRLTGGHQAGQGKREKQGKQGRPASVGSDSDIAGRLGAAGEALAPLLAEMPGGRLDVLAEALAASLAVVRDAAHECATELRLTLKRSEDDPERLAIGRAALTVTDEVHDTSARLLGSFHPDIAARKEVVWLDRPYSDDARRPPTLRVAPLEVGAMLADRLFGRQTVILTSATLTLGGSFEPLARQWGLPTLAGPGGGVRGRGTADGHIIPNGSAVESATEPDGPPRPAASGTGAHTRQGHQTPAAHAEVPPGPVPPEPVPSEPVPPEPVPPEPVPPEPAPPEPVPPEPVPPEPVPPEPVPPEPAPPEPAPPGPARSSGTGPGTPPVAGHPDDTDAAPAASAVTWSGIDVGSPFDHPRSGILYVARHLPPPGRDGLPKAYLDELGELIIAAGGRTLGLFSSMRAARQASDELRDRIGHPLLCQGDDATSQLITQFASDEPTCLFGTLSLWQGVDVPGPSLQLVAIDRIPFPRPDDPLASARQRAVAAHGGNGFMAVAATGAALLLAQGAGRLLRTMTDRGVVAILDPRLVTARYGSFLRASLPPLWTTTDPEVVRGALRRLAASSPRPKLDR